MPETAELTKFLRNLRAVRDYTSQPIDDAVLRNIVEIGRWSGSSSNSQPTEIVVVQDRESLKLIGQSGVAPATGAAAALVVVTPEAEGKRDLESFDAGRLVERLLLAAKAHGLGANIGTLKGDGIAATQKALGIPEPRRAWAVVTMGHTDVEARKARPANPNAGRKDESTFAHWEKF